MLRRIARAGLAVSLAGPVLILLGVALWARGEETTAFGGPFLAGVLVNLALATWLIAAPAFALLAGLTRRRPPSSPGA